MLKRAAFTLMEVNLAVFIMATGILAMVALYPLGFRENQQSREDVASAAAADGFFNPIVAALSSPDLKWSEWRSILEKSGGVEFPNNGWEGYCKGDKKYMIAQPLSTQRSTAMTAARSILNVYKGNGSPAGAVQTAVNNLNNLGYAFVATTAWRKNRDGNTEVDPSRVCLSLRATRQSAQLFAQPLFYAEVTFQGNPDE